MKRRGKLGFKGLQDKPRDKKRKYNVMENREMTSQIIKLYHGVVHSYAEDKSIFFKKVCGYFKSKQNDSSHVAVLEEIHRIKRNRVENFSI